MLFSAADTKFLPNGQPDPTAGVFDCDSEDGFDSAHCVCPGAGTTSVTWQDYYSDCLNGTILKHVTANVSACEAECAADKTCAAIAMQDGRGGSSCVSSLARSVCCLWFMDLF